jgi:Na+-transporting NADH:ubiquinone oxidoreductase subunit A
MVTQIKIKKGLDLKLKGEAQQLVVEPDTSEVYGLIPDDFYGITPKLAVKEGDAVKVGTVVFFDKTNPELKVVSPVCGTIKAVNRGENVEK